MSVAAAERLHDRSVRKVTPSGAAPLGDPTGAAGNGVLVINATVVTMPGGCCQICSTPDPCSFSWLSFQQQAPSHGCWCSSSAASLIKYKSRQAVPPTAPTAVVLGQWVRGQETGNSSRDFSLHGDLDGAVCREVWHSRLHTHTHISVCCLGSRNIDTAQRPRQKVSSRAKPAPVSCSHLTGQTGVVFSVLTKALVYPFSKEWLHVVFRRRCVLAALAWL